MKKLVIKFIVVFFLCEAFAIGIMLNAFTFNGTPVSAEAYTVSTNNAQSGAEIDVEFEKTNDLIVNDENIEFVGEEATTDLRDKIVGEVNLSTDRISLGDKARAEISISDDVRDVYFVENGIKVNGCSFANGDVELEIMPNDGLSKLDVYIQNDKLQWQETSIYAYTQDKLCFISEESEDDAWYKASLYKFENGLATEEQIEEDYEVFSMRSVVENVTSDSINSQLEPLEPSDEEIKLHRLELENSEKAPAVKSGTSAVASSKTYVKGKLTLELADGQVMPLKFVRVDLYDDEIIGSEYLSTTYTDVDGCYSFSFDNPDSFWDFENGGYDVFIKWYPDSYTFEVANDWIFTNLTYYSLKSSVKKNVSTGSTNVFDEKISYDKGNMANCAFYLAQGMVVAQRFAQAMGVNFNKCLKVKYPFTNGDNAFCWNKFAGIGKPYFDDFDTAMHEYGHFVEGINGTYGANLLDFILYNPSHSSYTDHFSDKKSKQFAMELTWSESWATAFAQIAQEYYRSEYDKVLNFADKKHMDSVNYEEFNSMEDSGEAQEDAVIAFLWDLYDSSSKSEVYGNISWGYRTWWKNTTQSGMTTLTKFIEYINVSKPLQRSDIGELLGVHQIAPTNLTVTNLALVSTIVAPKLSWKVNGSNDNPNDKFKVVFYDSDGNQKYITQFISSSKSYNDTFTYEVSKSTWKNVLGHFSDNATINIAVQGYHKKSPISGPYTSKHVSVKINAQNIKSLTIASNSRYTEDVVYLNAGEYEDYLITFKSGGRKLIQTFGPKDTCLYLYDMNGNQLAYNDDGGYKNNALISYDVSANVTYGIRVKFYSSSIYGDVKLAIMPHLTSVTKYEDLRGVYSADCIYEGLTTSGSVSLSRYTVNSTGVYTFYTDIRTGYYNYPNMYLYLIDPSSTEPSLYNDDGAGKMQAKITTTLKPGVEYLLVTTTYDILNSVNYSVHFIKNMRF